MGFLARSRLDLMTGTIAKLAADEDPRLAKVQELRAAAERCMPALIELGVAARALHEAA